MNASTNAARMPHPVPAQVSSTAPRREPRPRPVPPAVPAVTPVDEIEAWARHAVASNGFGDPPA